MKVIFLDIDGVLNIAADETDEFGHLFHKPYEENLKSIIDATGAQIVISSTWRMSGLNTMRSMWLKRRLPGKVIDVTPDCAQLKNFGTLKYYDAVERGHEIQDWLDRHPEVSNYVILDDCNDMLDSQQSKFVRTCVNGKYGLTKECTERAIVILNDKSLAH